MNVSKDKKNNNGEKPDKMEPQSLPVIHDQIVI